MQRVNLRAFLVLWRVDLEVTRLVVTVHDAVVASHLSCLGDRFGVESVVPLKRESYFAIREWLVWRGIERLEDSVPKRRDIRL